MEYEARIVNAPYVNEISEFNDEEEIIVPSGEIFKLINFSMNKKGVYEINLGFSSLKYIF